MKFRTLMFTAALIMAASPALARPHIFIPHKPHVVAPKVPAQNYNPWAALAVIYCAGGVVVSAIVKNARGKGELSRNAAMTCGVLGFFE